MALGKNVFYTLLTQIPTLLIGITSGIFLNRMLTPTGKGIWALLQTNVEIFAMFAVLGLPTAMLYFVSGNRMPVAKLMGVGVVAVTTVALLLGLTLWLTQGSDFYSFIMPNGPDQGVYILYLFIYFFGVCAQYIIDTFLVARNKVRRTNQLALITSVVTLATALLLYFVFQADNFYDTLVYFLLAQCGLFLFLLLFRIRLYGQVEGQWPSLKLNWQDHLKPLLAFSVVTCVAQLFNALNYRVVMWILEDIEGTAAVGLYTVSLNLAQLLWLFANPVQPLLISYLSNQEVSAADKADRLSFFLRLINTLSVAAALAMALLAPIGIELLYKEAYRGAILPFILLLPGIVLMNLNKILSAWFIANKKIPNLLVGISIGLIITLALNLVLIPMMGVVGAAVASSMCYASMTLFHVLSYRYFYKQPLRNILIVNVQDIKMLLRGKLPV